MADEWLQQSAGAVDHGGGKGNPLSYRTCVCVLGVGTVLD